MSEKKKKKLEVSDVAHLIDDIRVESEVPVLEKIKYPTIWDRLPSGYRIQDLQPTKIENAVEIVKEYYIKEDAFCRGVDLADDEDGVNEYLNHITYWLKDTQSLAAVEEGTGTVVGVLVGRVVDRTVKIQYRMTMPFSPEPDEEMMRQDSRLSKSICIPIPCAYSTDIMSLTHSKSAVSKREKSKDSENMSVKTSKSLVQGQRKSKPFRIMKPIFDDEETIVENPKLRAIHKFKTLFTRNNDVFSLYNVRVYYSIYLLIVTPQHRDRGIEKSLIKCCLEIAGRFGCDVVTGLFVSKMDVNVTAKENFKVIDEIPLSTYFEKNVQVFDHLEGHEKAVFMAFVRPTPPESTPSQSLNTPPRRKNEKK